MTVLLLIFISRAGPRKIFVRNKKNYCNRDTNFCDGSSEAPFGSLVEVFDLLTAANNEIQNEEIIEILLQVNNASYPYIFSEDYPKEKLQLLCDPFQLLKGTDCSLDVFNPNREKYLNED